MLRIASLYKSYSVPVLKNVNLDLPPGEVHALIGENGAGKSTLVRILCGLTQPDSGIMTLFDAPHAPRSRREAEGVGVRLVMQELNLIPTLSVAENIHFAALPRRFGWVDYGELFQQTRGELAAVGLEEIHPGTPVSALGVGQQQLVEIAAALSREGRILILDEPTAALTDPQIELLFQHLRRLKERGVGVLYISHRMEEIQRIADRVTVLRDGAVVASEPAARLSLEDMIRLMAGRPVASRSVQRRVPQGEVALEVCGLASGSLLRDISFQVRQGEILGLAGLIGSGRTETLRALFGADRASGGDVFLKGKPSRIRRPADAVRAGLGLIPEDRRQQGLLWTQSVRVNATLPNLEQVRSWAGWIDRGKESDLAARFAELLDLRSASLEQAVAELSGGNQQKVIMARWFMRDCAVFLFDEPTRGIDVATKWTIYQLLGDLAEAGKALVVASSDLLELMGLADRIAVLSAGRLAGLFDRPFDQEKIMAAAFSGYLKSADPG